MGVRKLKILVQSSNLLEDFTLTQSPIVIDAANIYYFLYFNSDPKLDQSHGGDYPGFKEEICRFFKALQDCEVTPHVVLDGGSNPEKLDTLEARLQNKLELAKKIAEQRPDSNILPPLVKDIFIQVLLERNIEFEQSCGEADPRVVSWANELHCPVLSDDSDFYIYDLVGGVLPPDTFQWKNSRNGQIKAKIYKRSTFCMCFHIDPVLVPVFASIAGNDFSILEDGGTFASYYRSRSRQNPWISRLYGILRFLSDLNLQDPEQKQSQALRAAFRFVGKNEIDQEQFVNSIKEYDKHSETPETRGDDLPNWMVRKLREGKLTSFITDILRHRRMMLTPLVEDFSQPSSYTAALRIRQFFYGLLTGEETCTEFDRVDDNSVSHKPITPLLPTVSQDQRQQLQLQHLDQAPEVLRCQVLLEALDSLGLVFENIPDHMKLPVYVTNFWWRYRQETNLQYLHALLLGFVYGEHLNPEGGFEKKMKDLKVEGEKIQLLPDVAHAFSQWQCCFRQSLHLNQLLCFPLPVPECSRFYCGPVVHRLAGPEPGPENSLHTVTELMDEDQRRLYGLLKQGVLFTGS